MSLTSYTRDKVETTMPEPAGWYAIHCKPLREQQTAEALATHLHLVVYSPSIVRRAYGKTRQTPLFPGYLFVKADLSAISKSHINATPGVLRLVEFGGSPQPLPDRLIEELRERVNSINAAGGLPSLLKPGDPIYIKSGRLRGLEAVFVASMPATARVRVLLHLLGRLNEVELESEEIEPANITTIQHRQRRQRRTRGRGRQIGTCK